MLICIDHKSQRSHPDASDLSYMTASATRLFLTMIFVKYFIIFTIPKRVN